MRLIEKFSESIKVLNDYRNLYHAESSSTEQYKVANAINDILSDYIKNCLKIDSDCCLLDEDKRTIILALEKQIPKKPEQGTTNAFIYVCPNCGGPVGSLEVEEIWCDFCPKCGQAIDKSLDWSDE